MLRVGEYNGNFVALGVFVLICAFVGLLVVYLPVDGLFALCVVSWGNFDECSFCVPTCGVVSRLDTFVVSCAGFSVDTACVPWFVVFDVVGGVFGVVIFDADEKITKRIYCLITQSKTSNNIQMDQGKRFIPINGIVWYQNMNNG